MYCFQAFPALSKPDQSFCFSVQHARTQLTKSTSDKHTDCSSVHATQYDVYQVLTTNLTEKDKKNKQTVT